MSADGTTSENSYKYEIDTTSDEYCFRVKARNIYGEADEWSEAECFTKIVKDLPAKMDAPITGNTLGTGP